VNITDGYILAIFSMGALISAHQVLDHRIINAFVSTLMVLLVVVAPLWLNSVPLFAILLVALVVEFNADNVLETRKRPTCPST